MTIDTTTPEDKAILNTEGFKPFTLKIDCITEGLAIQLWASLVSGTSLQREEVERHCGPAALAKFDEHTAKGLSEGTYPIWDQLDDMLVAQGVIKKH